MRTGKRLLAVLLLIVLSAGVLSGCGFRGGDDGSGQKFAGFGDKKVLRIVSGSENAELEPILEEFEQKENVEIETAASGGRGDPF